MKSRLRKKQLNKHKQKKEVPGSTPQVRRNLNACLRSGFAALYIVANQRNIFVDFYNG